FLALPSNQPVGFELPDGAIFAATGKRLRKTCARGAVNDGAGGLRLVYSAATIRLPAPSFASQPPLLDGDMIQADVALRGRSKSTLAGTTPGGRVSGTGVAASYPRPPTALRVCSSNSSRDVVRAGAGGRRDADAGAGVSC